MKNNSFCVCPLASGSKGNSVFVSCNGTNMLVDAGLSGIELERRLQAIDIDPNSIQALIITHEHSDHIKGAGILSRRFDIPVYINKKTFEASSIGKIERIEFFKCGQSFNINGIKINPFSISHDACDPAGFTMEYKNKKIGMATDTGIATNLVKEHLKDCSLLYIESNHDPEMLINGSYPWHLKQRIRSRTGHLSNQDSRDLLIDINHDNLNHVILAHLSEENNTPNRALHTVSQNFKESNITFEVAMPDKPGKIIKI